MDIINGQPDDILRQIVSFLSAKEAAFASVLSKRWRNLCTIIQNLEFDDMVDQNQGSLTNFVDGVLALPLGSRIRRFSIICKKGIDPSQHAQVNRCICNVLKNRGVLKVKLDINGYSLPFFEVFTCKTVVKLELGIDFTRNLLPKNAFLPALTTLVLDSYITDYEFQKLRIACPMLRKIELGSWLNRLLGP